VGSRAQRTVRGSRSPWTTRVVATTPSVMNTIRSQSGNASPEPTVAGTARAATRETAPRKPATVLTTRARLLTRRRRCCGRRSISRIVYAATVRNANRTTTITAHTTATPITAVSRSVLTRLRSADCASSPTSTKSAAFSRNVASVQNAVLCWRASARPMRGPI